MTPTHFTGLDLHKRSVTATTLDAAGTVVATAKMPCRPRALLAYFAQLPTEAGHAATVECTTGWYWVKDTLASGASDIDLPRTLKASKPFRPPRSKPTRQTQPCWPIF